MTSVPALGRLARWAERIPLWPFVVGVSVVVLLWHLPGVHASAWHWFHDAATLLTEGDQGSTPGGLHLYAERPDLQFGPLIIVMVVPLSWLGHDGGSWAAMILGSAAGVAAFALVLDAAIRLRPSLASGPRLTLLAAGAVTMLTWGDVAVRTTHIDDAVALLALAFALSRLARTPATGREHAIVIGALAVAGAVKPWAVALAPLAAVGAPAPPLSRLLRVGAVVAVVGATWLPFVLAEPDTLDTARYEIENEPTSVLRALGVDQPTTPRWARPLQLAGGFALAGALVVRGRWPAAMMGAIGWRLFLDPAANRYYTVGVVLGALLVELTSRRGRFPWFTIVVAVLLEATGSESSPDVAGRYVRFVTVAAVLAAAWLAPVAERVVSVRSSARAGPTPRRAAPLPPSARRSR